MRSKRWKHGCATFQMGGKRYGIVSGGSIDGKCPEVGDFGFQLDSTEVIDLDQRSPTWNEGMHEKSKIVLPVLLLKSFFLNCRPKITKKVV